MFKILFSALINTNNVIKSILGDNVKEDLINNKSSELNKSNWNISKLLNFIYNLFFLKLPIFCPSWVPYPINKIFFGGNSTYIPSNIEIEDDICVIFINGIMSNKDVIELNRKELSNLLNRPINILHNATDSFLSDLIECFIGKATNDLTEASTEALHTLCNKILNPKIKKILLICHSQGTIIISNVLQNLHKLGLDKEEYLKKIEIYAFANCSTKMNYIIDDLPYIESFANNNDIVASMGCNCSEDIKDLISIDGEKFICKKSGHMFNSHYINNFKIDYPNSKLNKYIKSKNFIPIL